jgi:hypothetical protein
VATWCGVAGVGRGVDIGGGGQQSSEAARWKLGGEDLMVWEALAVHAQPFHRVSGPGRGEVNGVEWLAMSGFFKLSVR